MAAFLKRVEHPLMRWVGEVEEVLVERAEEVHERAVLWALESQMDNLVLRCVVVSCAVCCDVVLCCCALCLVILWPVVLCCGLRR